MRTVYRNLLNVSLALLIAVFFMAGAYRVDAGTCPQQSCNVFSASLTTTLGTVALNSVGCCVVGAAVIPPGSLPCSAPAGYIFPYGMFSFDTGTIASGQTGQVTIGFPNPLPAGTKFFKCSNGTITDITVLVTRVSEYVDILTLDATGVYIIGAGFVSNTTPQSSSPWLPEASKAPMKLSNIAVKSATLSTTRVAPGEHVTVSADIANTGTGNGSSVIKVYVNGNEDVSQAVSVNSGSSTSIKFDVSRNDPGTYTVYVGGTQAGSFTVDEFTPNTILFISGALVFFALVIGVIYMTRRRA